MARSIHVRLDEISEEALSFVSATSGLTDSEAVRRALVEDARRRRSRTELRREVAEMMADPAEVAEIDEVRAFMDAIAAPLDPD